MILTFYIAVGAAFTIFLHRFTISQFPLKNTAALSNVVTSFAMWPIQLAFLMITATAFTRFGFKKAISKSVALMANCYIANINAVACAFILCGSFIVTIVMQHFMACTLRQHLSNECGDFAEARLALVVLLIWLVFIGRIAHIGFANRKRIACSVKITFKKLMED